MAGQHDPWLVERAYGRVEIRLGARLVMDQQTVDAETGQVILDPGNEIQIGVAAGGVESNQLPKKMIELVLRLIAGLGNTHGSPGTPYAGATAGFKARSR